MEITGKQSIAAARAAVWDALNDPTVLRKCLPGCESVERVSPDEFKVVLAAAIGPLRARFKGALRITEANAPASCVILFEGQGGAVGFGKGASSVTLEETPAGTELSYTAKAQIGGKLAQVGSRLIDNVAKKMSDDFFTAFKKQLAPAPIAPAVPVAPAPEPATAPDARRKSEPAAAPSGPVSTAQPAPSKAPNPTVSTVGSVPAWWLAVAASIGAAAAIAGANFIR